MNIRKQLSVLGSALCLIALILPVQYMGESFYGFNILLLGLTTLIPHTSLDIAVALASLATLQAILVPGIFVRNHLATVAFSVAFLGTPSAVLVAFINGAPSSTATILWLTGLLASLAGLVPSKRGQERQPLTSPHLLL
jgi:hypothetical protein